MKYLALQTTNERQIHTYLNNISTTLSITMSILPMTTTTTTTTMIAITTEKQRMSIRIVLIRI